MAELRLDCENCRHLTIVGLHDTGLSTGIVSKAAYGRWLRDGAEHVWAFQSDSAAKYRLKPKLKVQLTAPLRQKLVVF